ncbi:MAG: transposase [Solirubrobacteraceae bacterium]
MESQPHDGDHDERGYAERAGPERAARRRYTAEYKLGIVREADACTAPGEVGALLRREGLYTSHLTYWRKQRDAGALDALGRPRGRKPADRRDAQIAELQRRAERAEAELAKARRVIEVQGKSQRSWSRCSIPGARASPGAPGDDRADRRRPHAADRHPAGVPGVGRRSRHDLPPPASTGAPRPQAPPGAAPGAV